jgi:hypothetical protein
MTYAEQMQDIYKKYESAGMPIPATAREIATWAIDNKLWYPRPTDIISKCADDLAKALREEYKTDSKGRKVRQKHAIRIKSEGKQLTIWTDIDKAPRDLIQKAFMQRRQQIVGDCHQLKVDVDYYNNVKKDEEDIQLILDFTMDVLEIDMEEELLTA